MTVILAPKTFSVKGSVSVPGDDGQRLDIPFTVRFKRLKSSDQRALDQRRLKSVIAALGDGVPAWMKKADADKLKSVQPLKDDAELLGQVFDSMTVRDVDGNEHTCTANQRREFCEALHGLEAAVAAAYVNAIDGRPSQEKNSVALSGTGSDVTAQTTE